MGYASSEKEKDKNFVWTEGDKPLTLVARPKVQPRGLERGINEKDIDPIQQWCEEHNCGRRTSFDTFQFKNKSQITMFLLRWS